MSTEHPYERLYRETIPSVVSVYVTPDDRSQWGGSGSGFVYDETHLVTNEHVVGDADEVDLRFSEGDWRVGRVVGTDPYTDLAVLAVEGLPDYARPLPLADANPAPGVPVAALGNPMGLDGSISAGIVSGASRSMPTGNGFTMPDTVQTDAPINPGNSGGPLVTTDGAVVGVNRAKTGDNIGFAVSAEVVRRVVPDLIAEGRVAHSYLRVRTLDVSPTVAEANGLGETGGVLVVEVSRGPASGLLRGCRDTRRVRGRDVPVGGDVITAIDGAPVDSHEALMRHLLVETRPGESVTVDLVRNGRERTETVTLAERPAAPKRRERRRWGRRQAPGPRPPRPPRDGRERHEREREGHDGDGGHDIPVN
ncbi:trypsin-like peptidase domain-containing protein [Salinirubellus salinus]|uniref:Trypsin-like peptidase domain-containing protein n=1 Tax=Salinirubellus salinus TaxID=1364945 RepID=A0A9E7U8P3_9EURY|nr:trypsin-like peptidase domain-containing protein [Salinirubellus salinus]UWM55051.1 trypsin-like peptidase domain-containing protein [Salinirubellus salinus]